MLQRAILVTAVLGLLGSAGCSGDCKMNSQGVCVSTTQAAGTGTDGGASDGGATGGGTADGGSADGGAATADFGTVPSGAHVSLDCTPFNVPGFLNDDCLYSHWDGNAGAGPGVVSCTMKLADREGRIIGTATQVSFMSEAGAISPSASSPDFDPSKPVADQTDLGHAVGFLEVFGAPLPADVAPFAGEPSFAHDYGCGPRTANPRDGYVTVIAMVRGEEGFVDLNRNGTYDPGEPFVDLGEPYVDANDNGQWDPGEWYLDVNGNGRYDGPNGKWDADAVIWTQTRVLYTGLPAVILDSSGDLELSGFYAGTPAPPPAPFLVHAGPPPTTASYPFFLRDDRLNPMTTSATYALSALIGNVTTALAGPYDTSNLVGDSFRLLYCDKPDGSGTCLDGTVEYGCRTAPCYVVPEVGLCRTAGCAGLLTGNPGTAAITCSKVGPDTVTLSTTIDGVTVDLPITGECAP